MQHHFRWYFYKYHFYCTPIITCHLKIGEKYYAIYKGGLWLLSPTDEWIKAQRAQYNKFVELAKKLGFNEVDDTLNGVRMVREQGRAINRQM